MGRKLYVGNLSYNVGDVELAELFTPHGTVNSASVAIDRSTGQSRGFGFVEMGTDAEASAAIAALDGKALDGRSIKVNEARPPTRTGGGGGGAGRRNRW
ncbi:MAG: RNA-binding protein [Phycisphaerae bacterium]|nr:RNA-binding protein [Phycisphaerae bacterium]